MIPDRCDYDPVLGSYLATGECARRECLDRPRGDVVALDTETPGVTDAFTHKCVTAAWWYGGDVVMSVLLDPRRNPADAAVVAKLCESAGELVLQNAAFDVPGLVAAGLMRVEHVDKVTDTLVHARMAWPDALTRKRLSDVAARLLGWRELSGGMEQAFRACGYRTIEAGYAGMDVDSPIYRFGAMADTVATLRILSPVRAAAIERTLAHPFPRYGITDMAAAAALVEREQRVNRVMLRRSTLGLAVDLDALDRYRETVAAQVASAIGLLSEAGLRPGNGLDLVTYLDNIGDLPRAWPRTPKGKLSSAKGALERLPAHPLAQAHRALAHATKITGYLEKVADSCRVTGRLHPQVAIGGASATGRMSYSNPELQQFPEEARPIVVADPGRTLTSVDWTTIEPVVLANLARDEAFLTGYERGDDVYEPVMRAAGVPRKIAKVVLLATMYGQSERNLAASIGHTIESATQIKRQMLAAMPASATFMSRICSIAEQHGVIVTVSGRVLTIPAHNGEVFAYKAVNYAIQGSAYDLLAQAILRIEDAGLGEAIMLAMHDELVVDSEAAHDVETLMSVPPDELCAWAQRIPVLRTDTNLLGHAWKAV